MKVQLTTSLANENTSWRAGDLYECSEAEAKRLIAAGFAIDAPKETREHATKEIKGEKR
jgi:hypothetical protein